MAYRARVRLGLVTSDRDTSIEVKLRLTNESKFSQVRIIDFANNVTDGSTGSTRISAVFENESGTLSPGLFARTSVPTNHVGGYDKVWLLVVCTEVLMGRGLFLATLRLRFASLPHVIIGDAKPRCCEQAARASSSQYVNDFNKFGRAYRVSEGQRLRARVPRLRIRVTRFTLDELNPQNRIFRDFVAIGLYATEMAPGLANIMRR